MSDDKCESTELDKGENTPASRAITFGKARFASVERRQQCFEDDAE